MAWVDLGLPPGLLRRGTAHQSKGRWFEQTLVRWYEGAMRPIGGWLARTTTPMSGKCRAMVTWRDNVTTRFIALGTHTNLYALTQTSATPVDITPVGFVSGRANATFGAGYGVGPYGASTYGTPRIDNVSVQDASMWVLDTDGQDLVGVMSDDGKLYEWLRNTSVKAVATTGAPSNNSAVVVTPERFVMLLGANGVSRRCQWADQEVRTTWTATSTNQAGDYDIQSQGKLMCGLRLRTSTLIFTDLDAHMATYVGLPYVYRFDRIGDACGIISRGAAAAHESRAMWMGTNGFFLYDGTVRLVPCDVWDEVFKDINITQRSKVVAMTNATFSEVWWFYPSAASTENDKYVTYNIQEDHWNVGQLSRLACVDAGVFNNPLMVDASGYVYDHETGSSYTGAAVTTPFATSAPIEMGVGERIAKARELVPDEDTLGQVQVSFLVADSPTGSETTYGPYTPAAITPVRFAGRQARMKVQFVSPTNAKWGNPRLDVVAGGRR